MEIRLCNPSQDGLSCTWKYREDSGGNRFILGNSIVLGVFLGLLLNFLASLLNTIRGDLKVALAHVYCFKESGEGSVDTMLA